MKTTIPLASRLKGFDKPSIWNVMTPLANRTKSVNLGQGFPSWGPPQFFKDNLLHATQHGKDIRIQLLNNIAGLMELWTMLGLLLNGTDPTSENLTLRMNCALFKEVLKGYYVSS